MPMVCMSVEVVLLCRNCRGAVSLDEIAALVIVIILFSASTAMTYDLISVYERSRTSENLTETAMAIATKLTTHPALIYECVPGVFDIRRLLELENVSLPELTGVQDGYGCSVTVTDVNPSARIPRVDLVHDPEELEGGRPVEKAVIDEPVNIRLNEFEMHPGILDLALWR